MKYWKTGAIAAVASLGIMTGCVQQSSQAEYVGLDAAKAIAMAAADVSENTAVFTTAELEDRNGTAYYEIDFTVDGKAYEYDIDAMSGKIIETQSKPIEEMTAETAAANADAAADGKVTAEEAKQIALQHAGLKSDAVTFVKEKLERDDGRQKYDIEFYTSDFQEYDYEIDATTGEILSYDYDAEQYAAVETGEGITEEKAKEIALSQVSGATANDIYEWEVDYDDGRLQYEGKIYDADTEYEFTIDGYSGAIQSWETEPIRRP